MLFKIFQDFFCCQLIMNKSPAMQRDNNEGPRYFSIQLKGEQLLIPQSYKLCCRG